MTDHLLTTREAAAYLGVHLNTIARLCAKHGLPFYRLDRDRRFRREEIDAWLAARRT